MFVVDTLKILDFAKNVTDDCFKRHVLQLMHISYDTLIFTVFTGMFEW